MNGSFERGVQEVKNVTFAPIAVGPEVAASMTGTTRSTIFQAIANNELRAFKSGRRRLILVKDLEAWITKVARRPS
ncbi:excisionase family DNA-binding protein [Pseudomonas rossensis]|uniref:excisionase family DNA-binding protein n=1 Tax=Pseudomonas rossensis TaxID=2305471 RepID=UPI003260168B